MKAEKSSGESSALRIMKLWEGELAAERVWEEHRNEV